MSKFFFITEAQKAQINIVLRRFITDNGASVDGLEIINDEVNQEQILITWKKKSIHC